MRMDSIRLKHRPEVQGHYEQHSQPYSQQHNQRQSERNAIIFFVCVSILYFVASLCRSGLTT